MTRKTNIVSFDDVKAASRQRYAQERETASRDEGFGRVYNYYDLSRFADPAPKLYNEVDEDYDWGEYTYEEPRETARQARSRKRKKARAEKLFAKNYADDASSVDQAEGAPRAAVYEGKIGSSQRRAARMQLASQAGPVTAKINPAGWFSDISVSPRRLKVFTLALCLVLAVVFLYTPAQHYYQSVREHDRLVAEYTSIQERNVKLDQQNDALASSAGMEDAVRQKYGYVISGDETAVVSGLSDEAYKSSGDGVEANVLSSTVKAPEEWYTPFLDALFGVE